MIDNWKGDGGWRPEIMEGPHGGGRTPPWSEMEWSERLAWVALWAFVIIGGLCLLLAVAFCAPPGHWGK